MKEIKLKGTFPIDVKRFYVPFIIESKCKSCGEIVEIDLEQDYLSYPTLNEKESVGMYCRNCENEWEVQVTLGMTIKCEE